MKEYHKIQSIFKRYREVENKNKFNFDEFSIPEFEYLKNNKWILTEKVDGTNIRIGYTVADKKVEIGGRTKDAQIPATLFKVLTEMFPAENFSTFGSDLTLYGEGYGAKIQKCCANYIPDGNSFVLFDVMIGDWWLKREDVESIAKILGISVVPILGSGTLNDAIEMCQRGFMSTWGDFIAEGLVLRPAVELFARNGDRIITKVKYKDFH